MKGNRIIFIHCAIYIFVATQSHSTRKLHFLTFSSYSHVILLFIRSELDTDTWTAPRCQECSRGTYAFEDLLAVNGCFDCLPGEYLNETGGAECKPCAPGFYQVRTRIGMN